MGSPFSVYVYTTQVSFLPNILYTVTMRSFIDKSFRLFIALLTTLGFLALGFVLFFIVKESLPLFEEVSVKEFLFGQRWMPISMVGETSFGIFNFILSTLYVSLLAMIFATVLGVGAAVFLACVASERARSLLYPFIDLLAGIPSVIYGFIGLVTLVPLFRKFGVQTGSCVLAASLLLSIMLLPYLISSCSETILKVKNRYLPASQAMGVSFWYGISKVILPASRGNILLSMILAVGRAMGETMAVMMVIGNANLFPTLLGKGESIAGLIALEMGTAEAGSLHYHALFAAGLVLMVLLMLIHGGIGALRARIMKEV